MIQQNHRWMIASSVSPWMSHIQTASLLATFEWPKAGRAGNVTFELVVFLVARWSRKIPWNHQSIDLSICIYLCHSLSSFLICIYLIRYLSVRSRAYLIVYFAFKPENASKHYITKSKHRGWISVKTQPLFILQIFTNSASGFDWVFSLALHREQKMHNIYIYTILYLLRSVNPGNRTANREPNRKGISFYRTGKEPNRMDISFYETEPNRTDYKKRTKPNRTEPNRTAHTTTQITVSWWLESLQRLLAQVGLASQGFTWLETLTGRPMRRPG